ncbi:hypothetical protein [Clostridium sp.]|uniref:hypothetical protein n=1 Tax=Clostridium sp. TaxID=1506 RepID=UPI001A47D117|nr:hypothetical protein [Clostridium sp.]MBK5235243.1 hypothetical protein [Clostridium sp.]
MIEKKDTINTNSKSKILKIILYLSIFMTPIVIFFITYYSSINKVYGSYETTLVNHINGINLVNKNIDQFNSNQTIDVDYAKKQLPNIIKNLSDFRDNLANLTPTSKYKKDYENLKFGLDKNLLIYRQTLAILNNPSGGDVEISMDNLRTYRNDCMNFYSLVNIHNIKIELPKISLSFIDNVLNDSYTAVMMKKEEDITSEQNQEFINKIDALSLDFLDAKTNFYVYVIKARKKEMSYDDLLSLVDANFIKLNNIQTNFKSLSVPASAIPTYETLKTLLFLYESYLRDFKLALTSEKIQVTSAVVDQSLLDTLHTSSNKLFDEVEDCYNDFIKVYIELKDKK